MPRRLFIYRPVGRPDVPGQFPPAVMRPAEPCFEIETIVRIGDEHPITCMVKYQPDAILIWQTDDPTNVIGITNGTTVQFGKGRPRDYNVRDYPGLFIMSHPSRPGDTLQVDVGLSELADGLARVKRSEARMKAEAAASRSGRSGRSSRSRKSGRSKVVSV